MQVQQYCRERNCCYQLQPPIVHPTVLVKGGGNRRIRNAEEEKSEKEVRME